MKKENKKALKGIKLLIASNLIMIIITVAMAISRIVIVKFDIKMMKATITGNMYNDTNLWTMVIVAFFALLLGITGSIVLLVGVCKARKADLIFVKGIIPAVLILLSVLVIFYFEASEPESVNPVASAFARIVLLSSFTILAIIICFAVESTAKLLCDERIIKYCKRILPLVAASGLLALICSVLVSFLGKETLRIAGVRVITVFESLFIVSANSLMLSILFPYKALIKKKDQEEKQ